MMQQGLSNRKTPDAIKTKKTKYTVIKTTFSYQKWHVAKKKLQFAVFILQETKDLY
jgi:hypothetical protein